MADIRTRMGLISSKATYAHHKYKLTQTTHIKEFHVVDESGVALRRERAHLNPIRQQPAKARVSPFGRPVEGRM